MIALKSSVVRVAFCLVIPVSFSLPVFAADPAEQAVLSISQKQRLHLARIARRAVRDKLLGRGMYEPGYVPEALRSLEVEAVVRLRQGGYLRAAGAGGPSPVALAVRDAALGAAQGIGRRGADALALLDDLLIEIEVVGPPEPIEPPEHWHKPRALDSLIEPGVHGIIFTGQGRQHRYCPTEFFTRDTVLATAVEQAAQQMGATPAQLEGVKLARFRTAHWYQAAGADSIVSLTRGLTVVTEREVTRQGLSRAIDRLADYMVYRQTPTGRFAYQYEPAMDIYTDDDNVVRQAGATAAMAFHARQTGHEASAAAADLAIRLHLEGLATVAGRDDAAYIATPDGRNKLGVTALLCIALAEHPDAKRYEDVRAKLVRAILWLQRPSGMFITAFPPAESIAAQDYFPGEALLALAADYDREPSADVLAAFDRAIAFYRVYFRESPSPAFVPWQVQAYAKMARHSKREDYATWVFELTDWLGEHQLTPGNCAWPEMWGGIASYQRGRAGVATAAYLEGFADALVLAREVGDERRARRYESLVRRAARFVMQLQVRPEEAYFIISKQDAVGGIRTTPSLNLLRIDHCQHALVGLIKARDALFPGQG